MPGNESGACDTLCEESTQRRVGRYDLSTTYRLKRGHGDGLVRARRTMTAAIYPFHLSNL